MATPAYDTDVQEFDFQRKKAEQQVTAQKQGQQDALKRRFAAMGNINSGAYLKANQMVDQNAGTQLNQANEGINAAQNSELRRRREVVQGQEFAAGEAEKGRSFVGDQSALQRAFQTQERLGSQDFSSGERKSSQDFSSGLMDKQQSFASAEAQKARDNAEFLRTIERNQAADQFNKQYELDKSTTEFNKAMAEAEASKKNGGLLGSVFGDIAPGADTPLGKILGAPLGQGDLGKVINPVGAISSNMFGGGGGGGFF